MHAPQKKPSPITVHARDIASTDVVIFDGREMIVQSVDIDRNGIIKGSRKSAMPILIKFITGEELRLHPATEVSVIRL